MAARPAVTTCEMSSACSTEAPVASPCIGVCELDPADICKGCGRSLRDIADWSAASEPRRREILSRARQRMEKDTKPA